MLGLGWTLSVTGVNGMSDSPYQWPPSHLSPGANEPISVFLSHSSFSTVTPQSFYLTPHWVHAVSIKVNPRVQWCTYCSIQPAVDILDESKHMKGKQSSSTTTENCPCALSVCVCVWNRTVLCLQRHFLQFHKTHSDNSCTQKFKS